MHLLVCHPNHSWYFFYLKHMEIISDNFYFFVMPCFTDFRFQIVSPCFRSVTEHDGVLAICKHLRLHICFLLMLLMLSLWILCAESIILNSNIIQMKEMVMHSSLTKNATIKKYSV